MSDALFFILNEYEDIFFELFAKYLFLDIVKSQVNQLCCCLRKQSFSWLTQTSIVVTLKKFSTKNFTFNCHAVTE